MSVELSTTFSDSLSSDADFISSIVSFSCTVSLCSASFSSDFSSASELVSDIDVISVELRLSEEFSDDISSIGISGVSCLLSGDVDSKVVSSDGGISGSGLFSDTTVSSLMMSCWSSLG